MSPRVSRRGLLGLAGLGATSGAVGLGSGLALASSRSADPVVPFHGAHQAGILTPTQDRLFFAAFDVLTEDREELAEMLRTWTRAAEQLTRGESLGGDEPPVAPPADTGEAQGLHAARLTLTFGFGPSLFVDVHGRDRFGLTPTM